MSFEINLTDLEDTLPEVVSTKAPDLSQPAPKPKRAEKTTAESLDSSQAVVDTAAMLLEFERKANQLCNGLSKSIVEQTMSLTAQTADSLLGDIKRDLAAIRESKTQVKHFKFKDADITKLDRQPHTCIDDLIKILNTKKSNGRWFNLFIYGPAGSGKTSVGSDIAKIMGVKFYCLTMTAGMSETWLLGRWTVNDFVEAGLMLALEHGGIFLADEICASDPNCSLIMASMVDCGPGTEIRNPISGKTFKKHPDFRFIAADNTVGMGANAQFSGRMRMDAAMRDRFWFYEMDYCPKIEKALCPDQELREKLLEVRKALRDKKSDYFIGTRKLEEAYCLKSSGWKMPDIFKGLTAGWPAELAKQVGLAS